MLCTLHHTYSRHINIYNIKMKVSCTFKFWTNYSFNQMGARDEKWADHQSYYNSSPEWNMNVWTKSHSNSSNSCWDISVWSKVVDGVKFPSTEMQLAWLKAPIIRVRVTYLHGVFKGFIPGLLFIYSFADGGSCNWGIFMLFVHNLQGY